MSSLFTYLPVKQKKMGMFYDLGHGMRFPFFFFFGWYIFCQSILNETVA